MSGSSEQQRLWDAYNVALAEYRFQVNLNWSRLNYHLGLNVAITAAAAGFLSARPERLMPAIAFAFGAVAAGLALLTDRVSRAYYHSARKQKGDLEDKLELGDWAVKTTAGMGGEKRFWKVRYFHSFLLVTLLALDLSGLGYSICSANRRPTSGTRPLPVQTMTP